MDPASQIIFLTFQILKSSPGIEVLNVFDFGVFLFLNTYVQYQEHLTYLTITLTALRLRSTGTQKSENLFIYIL